MISECNCLYMSGSELSGIYSLVFVSFYLLWEGSSLGTIRNENLTCSRKVRFYKIHLWWNTRWVNKSALSINAKAYFGEDVEEAAHTQLGLTGRTRNYRGETPTQAFWGLRTRVCVLPKAGSLPSAAPRPGLLSAELRASLGLFRPGAAGLCHPQREARVAGGDSQLLSLSQRASRRPAALRDTASPLPHAC